MKVVIVQPLLPKYDIPLLEKISALPGIELVVLADLETKHQLNQYDSHRDQFDAQHLGRRHLLGIEIRPQLFSKLRQVRPDIVVLQGNPRDISQASGLFWCRIHRIPVGVWSMFHRIGKQRLVSELYYRYASLLSDLLMSYGERGKRELIERGAPIDKIIVLTTAVDEQEIIAVRDSVTDNEVAEFRAANGLIDKRVLLHVVRLTAIKRPDVMVKYFALLVKQRPDVELVMIGGGPLEQEMKELATSLGVATMIRFLGPIYDERKLALWYKVSDVFVVATCIGLSIHHAMCYGLPVVTDDNELTQASEFEVLRNGENGLTYRSGNTEDFIQKINRILDDDELRLKLAVEARRTIEEEYTLERKVRNFSRAFDLLNRNHHA